MRNKRLDVLRGIAVLLVVFYHGSIRNRLTDLGWAGVDLFFVLSGFLISGLLFTEYKKTGAINFKRFFVRRGLKLYPAFYFLLAITLIVESVFHHIRPLSAYLNEALYVQNYRASIWPHTWSLAVEEHFYIFLPLLLSLLISASGRGKDPFRALPWIFLFVALACLAFRLSAVRQIPIEKLGYWENVKPVFAPTHERMDSLFFGVLIGYLYHLRPEFLDRLTASGRSRIFLSVACIVLLLSSILADMRFLVTLGYTLMYLGFGTLLVLSMKVRGVLPMAAAKITEPIGSVVAYIGMYSYSIYLWHIAVSHWEPILVEKVFRVQEGWVAGYISYLAASVTLGILMSCLVEYPILQVRDRLFPGVETKIEPTLAERQESG
jgi:peptidoglycan/LPS O-acetylase OafA/YrhL